MSDTGPCGGRPGALRIYHSSPRRERAWKTGAERCVAACYDCLLSYSNQLQHNSSIDTSLRTTCWNWPKANFAGGDSRDYDEQYRWLLDRTDGVVMGNSCWTTSIRTG